MQFTDLKAQYESMKKEIDAAIEKVLDRGDYILGEDVGLFEKELAVYVKRQFCLTCANGTDALSIALETLEIGENEAVFLPDFTFFATAETVTRARAVPVFVDVNPDTFNIDCEKLEQAILSVQKEGRYKPRAIIPVDLFGLPCDYGALEHIAKKYDLLILEDGAQGFGGEYKGRKACSFGKISTTSFFPAKPLGCYGDGGAIFTDDEVLFKQMTSLRFHGKGEDKYDNVQIGFNSRLDTIQAAILRIKLAAFKDYELARRQEISAQYDLYLKGAVKTPFIPSGYLSSYAQYTIILPSEKKRTETIDTLRRQGIPSMVYYPKCMHQQSAYKNNKCLYYDVKESEKLTKTVLSLPMHPYLKTEEISKIADAITKS